jgi:hypothetical protein
MCELAFIEYNPTFDSIMPVRHAGTIPYIASFLTSRMWNGTVNHVFSGDLNNVVGNQHNRARIRIMPAVNSMYMEGPTHTLLVLTDYTSQQCPPNIRIRDLDIPVYRGTTVPAGQIPNFMHVWNNFWANANPIANITRDCMYAHKQISQYIGVENACLIANSVVAELYTTQYQGVAVTPYPDRPQYNWNVPGSGAWSFYADDFIAKGSRLRTHHWDTSTDQDHVTSGRRLVGYNFSAISAWARPPTGVVKTAEADTIYPDFGRMRVGAQGTSNYHTPGYNFESTLYIKATVRTCVCYRLKNYLTDFAENFTVCSY